ncbi:hypothetical protein Psta_1381 [Pirellula staleyi DSM 6068]|uniref:Uncharacterized protein n=1 Tax=Pirellula staleyi (strain ATCC 27377 / DSM 6068 / ICPB 4128) TaxID=530564 RepID=D2QWV4_PIRSD|nr:hypothetical protein [Pirellula staleyi]ADB16058.1 hypothetical protein Psta_1381 [Pirellula staleyi DSM 6068]
MNYNLVDDGCTEEEIEALIERNLKWSLFGAIFSILCPTLITAIVCVFYANKAAHLVEHYEVGYQYSPRIRSMQYFGYTMLVVQLALSVISLRFFMTGGL